MSDDSDRVDRDLDSVLRAWLLTQPSSTIVPAIIRTQAREFVLGRNPSPPPASLDRAIIEVRKMGATWGAADFVYWALWVRGSCGWSAGDPGWVARLLDDVATELSAQALAAAVDYAWKASQSPQVVLPSDRWGELFAATGYIENSRSAQRPSGFVTLYRGATTAARRNWSWTSLWATAEVYRLWCATEAREAHQANPAVEFARSAVWVARVPWTSVLARTRTDNPIDEEWVVNTDAVTVRRFDDSPRSDHLPHCRVPGNARIGTRESGGLGLLGPVSLGPRPAERCLQCGVIVRRQPARGIGAW